MTTRKPYHKPNGPVSFGRPVIGPRVYLVRGPSGWSETYERKVADKAFRDFIAPLDPTRLAEAFIKRLSLEVANRWQPKTETWEDLIEYLAEITQHVVKEIPEVVVVGFWAHLILITESEGAN